MGFLYNLRVAAWGVPPDSKAERRLLLKIDWFILSYVCLMYWVNYLDRANLNNAYVSGAEEDLNFQGTQLNQINTIVSISMIRTLSLPRYWLTFCLFLLVLRWLSFRSNSQQPDTAKGPTTNMATHYLYVVGFAHARNWFHSTSLANHGHPVLSRLLRGELLRWCAVDLGILVQA